MGPKHGTIDLSEETLSVFLRRNVTYKSNTTVGAYSEAPTLSADTRYVSSDTA